MVRPRETLGDTEDLHVWWFCLCGKAWLTRGLVPVGPGVRLGAGAGAAAVAWPRLLGHTASVWTSPSGCS